MQQTRRDKLSNALMSALNRVVDDDDAHLINVSASERAISHRIGTYLQEQLAPWDVDCEYNRDGIIAKYIHLITRDSDDDDGNYKLPDVIVHKRGTSENILVIEVKKSSNRTGVQRDIDKLHSCLSGPLSYLYAALVVIRTDDSMGKPYKLSWIQVENP